MTSHDVCRQHRRLPRLGQWPAALAVPCPGRQGMRRSGARGRGEAGCGPGDLPLLQGREAGKDILFYHGCRSQAWGQGPGRMERRERQAGHGHQAENRNGPLSGPASWRVCSTGRADQASPVLRDRHFPRYGVTAGRLGAEPALDFFRAGDAPRAHDAAIDDHRRGG